MNVVSQQDAYLFPWIDENVDVLGGYKLFYKLDLESGYRWIAVKTKTAFTVSLGLFQHKVIFFSIFYVSATFGSMMEKMIQVMFKKQCIVYLGDMKHIHYVDGLLL